MSQPPASANQPHSAAPPQAPFSLQVFCQQVAAALKVSPSRVDGAATLLDDGNTIPFIARYRKEATGGLDERQLRHIEDALANARELAGRRNTILKSIFEQGKLTPELQQQILACSDQRSLEELYLPFKPRKRTRAAMARERGLQPLADLLLAQQPLQQKPLEVLARFKNPALDVPDEHSALQGACDIVAETWAENPQNRRMTCELAARGELTASVRKGREEEGARFSNYFSFRERIASMPSHRFLALQRGESEGILKLHLELDDELGCRRLAENVLKNPRFEFHSELRSTVTDCFQRLLRPAAESSVLQQHREKADAEAVDVFARNLRDLLMAAPAGQHVTIGIDPGFRTGCKLAVVDSTGQFLASETIFPTPPREDLQHAENVLLKLIRQHNVRLIAIGNGTASRETDRFVADVLKRHNLSITQVSVSEAGASVYSASETAIAEYPDLDVTVRGAVSIAHRLQDPLAELVKIDPRSIGVGQYQHDVDQTLLRKALDREVESCVNAVGVDLNTASAPLLTHVAGIGTVLAGKIVAWRNENGPFASRRDLLKVPRLGQKAFQQAAGFLRIRGGTEPLDGSAVHPEQYPLVQKMARRLQLDPAKLIGSQQLIAQLSPAEFISSDAGEFTVRDVLAELARPGRDPRSEFRTARFADGISEIEHLQPGMELEGIITNVTKFGAFVDIGVHQDGLIHISQLADHFIKDPAEVVSAGQIVHVTVLEIDTARRRIALRKRR
ncbi:MAG: ribosomal protein [Planctomycetota bacterium]